MKKSRVSPHIQWYILLAIGLLAVLFGIWARAYNLSFPNKTVFDEVYFPTFAKDYLTRTPFFDVHPPLGKFLIATGIATLGDNTIGWRIVPLIFGIGNIGLMGYLWWSLFKDKIGTVIISMLMAIDGIFIIYSRTGLMDGILFFFIFLSLLLMVKLKDYQTTFIVATVIGLTASVKWVGLAVLVPIFFIAVQQKRWKELGVGLVWSAFVYEAIVTIGQVLIGSQNPIIDGLNWNQQAWHYQTTLTATHPYSSLWWTWPLLKKPVLFLYDYNSSTGLVNAMTTRGNTFVWWVSSVMVVVSLLYLAWRWLAKREKISKHPLMLLMVGYMACYLPFIPIHRVMFLYHYMPAYGFALMILTYWLVQLWKIAWWAVILFLLIAIGVSIYFLPLAVGWIAVTPAYALTGV